MILADKITEERKKNGWSQEELANQLGVSRQAVSKWESAGAVPDLQRILQMSELFGVSTDYLLKDEMKAEKHIQILLPELSKHEIRHLLPLSQEQSIILDLRYTYLLHLPLLWIHFFSCQEIHLHSPWLLFSTVLHSFQYFRDR